MQIGPWAAVSLRDRGHRGEGHFRVGGEAVFGLAPGTGLERKKEGEERFEQNVLAAQCPTRKGKNFKMFFQCHKILYIHVTLVLHCPGG